LLVAWAQQHPSRETINKEPKTHKPFIRSTLGFLISILWFQKFGRIFQNFSISFWIYSKGT
jgi:hypothetical protein